MRGRTTAAAMLVTALALVGVAIVIVGELRKSLVDEVDRSLNARIAFIDAQLDERKGRGVIVGSVRQRDFGLDTLELILNRRGRVLIGSDNTGDGNQILDQIPGENLPFDADASSFERTEGNDNMRLLSIFDEPDFPGFGRIVVGTSLDGVDATVDDVRRVLLIAGPALVLGVGLLVWLLVGRALKPVGVAQREADLISGSRIDRRLPDPGTRDEIAALTATINSMLDRIDQAQQEQRRFIADASHELRTPLAAIATQLEVSLLHPESSDWREVATGLKQGTDRLQGLVDDMLLNARWEEDGGASGTRSELVDLGDIVLEEAHALGAGRPGTVDTSSVSGGVVRGDPDELRRLARNLIGNGLRHAASSLVISLVEDERKVTLRVDDDGPGIAETDRERVFERFARLDDARDRDSGGSGLGLAICREIAHRHRGSIAASESPGGGARFEVVLPTGEGGPAALI